MSVVNKMSYQACRGHLGISCFNYRGRDKGSRQGQSDKAQDVGGAVSVDAGGAVTQSSRNWPHYHDIVRQHDD